MSNPSNAPRSFKLAHKLDPRVDSDRDEKDRQREDVASSTRYMPQAGNRAGKYDIRADTSEQRVIPEEETPRGDNVAGSSHFIPQSGKPAGKSTL